jgi:hypothetical protein
MTDDARRPRVSPSGPELPASPGGTLNVSTYRRTVENSTPLPGDGTPVLDALTLTHTSQTGKVAIWAAFSGDESWDTAPVLGVGNFHAAAAIDFDEVGQFDYAYEVTSTLDATKFGGAIVGFGTMLVDTATIVRCELTNTAPGGSADDTWIWNGTLIVMDVPA